jgi:hypothetical protein
MGSAGQFCVTTIRGAVTNGQVADFVSVTTVAVQASLPRAVTVLLMEHASAGVVKLAVKLAVAPAAKLGTVNTVLGVDWLLTTVTLFRATLPEFLTVPV